MNRILASSVGLTTTILLLGACGGAGRSTTGYSNAAANATMTPTGMETTPYPEGSPTGMETATPGETMSPTGTPTGMTPIPTPERAMIKVADSKVGKILVGEKDRTLYIFEKDMENMSNCYNACAVMWPPALTRDKPWPGTGAKEDMLGTMTRKQGEKQVTYNKHPLYYYIGDKKPGDMTGQGKGELGGKWYVISPDGKKVE